MQDIWQPASMRLRSNIYMALMTSCTHHYNVPSIRKIRTTSLGKAHYKNSSNYYNAPLIKHALHSSNNNG